MSESNQPEKNPAGSAQGDVWDSATDKELDQALSKASDLADKLVDQLGRPESAEPSAPNPLEDKRSDLDAELGQLAELTQTASEQLQGTPPSASAAVPDFMAEFMEPEAPKPAAAAEHAAPVANDSLGDDLMTAPVSAAAEAGSAPKGVVGGVINITIPAGKLRKEAETTRTEGEQQATAKPRRSLVEAALNPIAVTLEAVDKPFAKLNNRARRIAAGLGIALLITSGILIYLRLM